MAAEAGLAEAQAGLQRTVHGMRAQDVSATVQESLGARANAALAKSELERAQGLAKSGAIAEAELDQVRRKYEASEATYAAAAARALEARAGSRQEDVLIAEAQTRIADAHREEARAMLARTQIFAPFTGEVLRVKGRVGEYHNPASGDPIVIFGDTRRVRLRLDVDERDVARAKVGAPAYATAPAFGVTRFPGKVIEVARHMGRRNVRVDDPVDRVDVKILEVIVELDGNPPLISGLRMEGAISVAE